MLRLCGDVSPSGLLVFEFPFRWLTPPAGMCRPLACIALGDHGFLQHSPEGDTRTAGGVSHRLMA